MRRHLPACVAGSASLLLFRAAALAAPGYDIYAVPIYGTDTTGWATGISTNGTFVAGMTEGTNRSNGVLYNVSSQTAAMQSQTGVVYGRGTVETYGVPYSVNNSGIMFGSSGVSGPIETGEPTVWQNGQGYSLPLPSGIGAGQVYGSNNYNTAVGSIGGDGGLNQAAIFHYYGPNSSSNYTTPLNNPNTTGIQLNSAFGINDSYQVVGTATNTSNYALTVPYFYDLQSGTVTVIPNSSSKYNAGIPFAISNTGLVTGSELYNSGGGSPFIYNSSSGVTTSIPLPPGASEAEGRGINDSGEVVGYGGGQYSVPFLYDGSATYNLSSLIVNNTTGAWNLLTTTDASAFGISDNGVISGRAELNGQLTGFVMVPTGSTVGTSAPSSLAFNNTGGTGDGTTWDTAQQNFNNGVGAVAFSSANGDYVTFSDINAGHYAVSIPTTVTPGSTTVNNSAGNYVFTGAGGIGGTGGLTKLGSGTLTLNTSNSYTGPTTVSGGTLIFGTYGALPPGTNLTISGTGSSVVVAASTGNPYQPQVGTLNISTGATLDLKNNDLMVSSGTLTAVTALLQSGYNSGHWNGSTGIVSSFAGLTGGLMSLGAGLDFQGNVLVDYTYCGDANLDGTVDGSDYSLIDNGYANHLTGWLNGDFNYDGVIDGSDYSLIDNAFNNQGTQVATDSAAIAEAVAGSPASVPEPATLGIIAAGISAVLARRGRIDRRARAGE